MKYQIHGGNFPGVDVTLDSGESVYTQSGAMAWSDSDVSIETDTKGGFLQTVGRMLSGASLMFVTHTAHHDNSNITFANSFPGTIIGFEVDENHRYIGQKSSFLVADKGVNVEAIVTKSGWAGLFGGEGFFLQEFSGNGTVLAQFDGSVKEMELAPGQQIKVNSGHVAMFESTVSYDIESLKGFKNILFSGQGLFMTALTGPGKVYLQTLTAEDVANRLIPYLPRPTSSNND